MLVQTLSRNSGDSDGLDLHHVLRTIACVLSGGVDRLDILATPVAPHPPDLLLLGPREIIHYFLRKDVDIHVPSRLKLTCSNYFQDCY